MRSALRSQCEFNPFKMESQQFADVNVLRCQSRPRLLDCARAQKDFVADVLIYVECTPLPEMVGILVGRHGVAAAQRQKLND